jgi:chromosome segregation ATPase
VELVEEINYKEVAAGFEAAAAEASNQLAEAQTSHETLLEQFNTLTAEKETLTAEFETLRNELSTLQAEFEKQLELFNQQAATLAEKDATIAQQSETITDYENKEKDSLLAKFSTSMPADILQSIADRKNSLTIKELNTELALEYTKFSMAKEHKEEIRIPQDTTPTIAPEKAALFKILDNYKK